MTAKADPGWRGPSASTLKPSDVRCHRQESNLSFTYYYYRFDYYDLLVCIRRNERKMFTHVLYIGNGVFVSSTKFKSVYAERRSSYSSAHVRLIYYIILYTISQSGPD